MPPQNRAPSDLTVAKDQIWRKLLDAEARLTAIENKTASQHGTVRIWKEIQDLQKKPSIAGGDPVFQTLNVEGDIIVGGDIDGYDLSDVILARELEEGWKVAYKSYYKEFAYTAGALTNIGIWESAAKVTKLFNKDLAYVAGALTTVTMTRLSDGKTLTKTLAYVAGALTTITAVAT